MSLPVHDLALFAGAALLLNLTPGADMLFVAGSTAAQGRRAGLLAALGVGAGCLVHVALAAAGLTALLAASAWAFDLVKWTGAAYLVWLGISMWRSPRCAARPVAQSEAAHGRVFWRGALTNALNPKVALFFLAFLPQFIAQGAPGQAAAFVALGLWFTASGTLVNLAVALVADRVRAMASGQSAGSRIGGWLQRLAGALFVVLGVRLALAPRG
jgi:threonine/homoserine/homoserine lactone efflux protein